MINRWTCWALMAAVSIAATAAGQAFAGGIGRVEPSKAQSAEPARIGLWINRWDYRTPDDIDVAVQRAASLGVTDVYWQVRGQADAFYESALEPWGQEIIRETPEGRKGPGFDPLMLAAQRAQVWGVRLHAWVNVMPLWKGTEPPRDPEHPYNKHPEWRLMTADGTPQALNEHYVIVNPALPAVQDHIVSVCVDIARRYPIAGVHLDYVRYVSDSMKGSERYMEDPATMKMFRADQESRSAADGQAKTKGFAELSEMELRQRMYRWKTEKITEIVERIATEARSARQGMEISAAVWRTPELATGTYAQDAPAWLKSGTVDRLMPMIYTPDDRKFEADLSAWLKACPELAIMPGIGIYQHAAEGSGPQFAVAKERCPSGIALYAYASLFESVDPKQVKTAEARKERADRLLHVRGLLGKAVRPRQVPVSTD